MSARRATRIRLLRRCAAFEGLRACSYSPGDRRVVDGRALVGDESLLMGTAASRFLALCSGLAPPALLSAVHAVQV